jgi:hypothetical protein
MQHLAGVVSHSHSPPQVLLLQQVAKALLCHTAKALATRLHALQLPLLPLRWPAGWRWHVVLLLPATPRRQLLLVLLRRLARAVPGCLHGAAVVYPGVLFLVVAELPVGAVRATQRWRR